MILTLLGMASASCSPATQQCPDLKRPVSTTSLGNLAGGTPLDTAVFRLYGKPYLFLTSMVGAGEPFQFNPVTIYEMTDAFQVTKLPVYLGRTQHVRQLTQVQTPWGPGVLMADHGVDGSGFPGGELTLLVKPAPEVSFEDRSAELKTGKNFSFNAIGLKRKDSPAHDILIAPYNGPKSRVVYFQSQARTYVDKSQTLPNEWTQLKKCFMTAIAFDLDQDGTDEAILGGCDLDKSQGEPESNDRVITLKKNHWMFEEKSVLPLRKKNPYWGTVYWLSDGERLLALTHNKGFTEADLQIFYFDKLQKKFREEKLILHAAKTVRGYFHKIQKFDNSYIGLIRYTSPSPNEVNLFRIQQDKMGVWQQRNLCLQTREAETVLGIDALSEAGREWLLVTYYSGKVDIFESLPKI